MVESRQSASARMLELDLLMMNEEQAMSFLTAYIEDLRAGTTFPYDFRHLLLAAWFVDPPSNMIS